MNDETLARCRAGIDDLDRKIAPLLAERFALSDRIGQYKAEQGLPVRNAEREAEVLADTAALAGPQYAEDIKAVYEAVFARSRLRQTRLKDTSCAEPGTGEASAADDRTH